MTLTDRLITEIEQEASNTKKILECVPEDKFDWQPHEKSMTLKQLATHIAQLQGMAGLTLQHDNHLDLALAEQPEVNSAADLIDLMENGLKHTIEALKATQDDEFRKDWELRFGDKVLMKMSKLDFMRKMGLNHIVHHRGQLSVYLRLLDVPIPGMYGPSADER